MEDFPFAENELVVRLIFRDIGKAMWAVPVIFWSLYRLKRNVDRGSIFWSLMAGSSVLSAIGWIVHLAARWAIATSLAVDVPQLRRDAAAFDEWGGVGRIGYFDCTLTLDDGRTLPWSARKMSTFRDANGARWLWVEGNAAESVEIAAGLKAVAPTLGFPPPSAEAIDALAKVHKQNRVPLMSQWCGREPAKLLIFREPNGYVTPCLAMRL